MVDVSRGLVEDHHQPGRKAGFFCCCLGEKSELRDCRPSSSSPVIRSTGTCDRSCTLAADTDTICCCCCGCGGFLVLLR